MRREVFVEELSEALLMALVIVSKMFAEFIKVGRWQWAVPLKSFEIGKITFAKHDAFARGLASGKTTAAVECVGF